MKKMINLTPWYPGDVKPVRVGVYQQKDGAAGGDVGYQFWDGSSWSSWCRDAESASRFRFSKISDRYQNDPWRGISGKPE